MYVLVIFQSHMPITLGVMAQQSINISLYSKNRENKTVLLTYEWNVVTCVISFTMNGGIYY